MLAGAIYHFSRYEDPVVFSWLKAELGTETVSVPLARDDDEGRQLVLVIGQNLDGSSVEYRWSDPMLLRLLNQQPNRTLATSVAWLLCRFFDVDFNTDRLLRSYLKAKAGLVLEEVPFVLVPTGLLTSCAVASCTGNTEPNDTDDFRISVDKTTISVLLPLDSQGLRDLLFSRLRRIADVS